MRFIESQQSTEQDPMKQLEQLVELAISGNDDAKAQLDEMMAAAEKRNPQEAQKLARIIEKIAQKFQGQTTMARQGTKIEEKPQDEKIKYLKGLKCGGKAKKPKKAEKGFKATCGCKLKRIGGVIMEVDACTELPIDKKK